MPLAAHAVWQSGESAASVLEINAAWAESEPDDDPALRRALVRACLSGPVSDLHQAAALGERVAARLVAGGAKSLRRVD